MAVNIQSPFFVVPWFCSVLFCSLPNRLADRLPEIPHLVDLSAGKYAA